MSWSNPDHSGNFTAQDDMDSSDGTNAKRLVVRNAAATSSGAFRAEIHETSSEAGYLALRVEGATQVLRATGQTSVHPVLTTEGETHLTNPTNTELALRVQGKTQLERLDVNDRVALTADGNVIIRINEADSSRTGALRH